MARIRLGQGLGARAVDLSKPFAPDSDIDTAIRIPIRNTAYVRPRPVLGSTPPPTGLSTTPSTIGPGFPRTPMIPTRPSVPTPTPPPPAPPTTPQPTLPGYDPQALNFEGSTFNPQTSPLTSTKSVSQVSADSLLSELEAFSGLKIDPTWRSMSPDQLMESVTQTIEGAKKSGTMNNRPDTSFRTRLDDWLTRFRSSIGTTTTPNADFQTGYLGQSIFNNAIERLKLQGAADSREQDEALLGLLASRGLLQSGTAARELTALREARQRNFMEAASRLNEMLLQNELGRLTQRDLMTLQSDLSKRNNEAYLRLQQRLANESQPSDLAQILGTAIGTGLPFLLSPRASRKSPSTAGHQIIYDDQFA